MLHLLLLIALVCAVLGLISLHDRLRERNLERRLKRLKDRPDLAASEVDREIARDLERAAAWRKHHHRR